MVRCSEPLLQAPSAAELFPLSEVHLLEGPFLASQKLNLSYVRALDADRLLAPFRTEAGLPAKALRYGNWESSGLDGHTAGHYLTALAQLIADTGDRELDARLDHCLEELAACQQAHGNGYVGGVRGSRELWEKLGSGVLKVDAFGINGHWVPWYNLHKTFAGLRDAWLVAGKPRAREILLGLGAWCDQLLSKLSDEQLQDMLRCEHGGMNEVLADIAAISGDRHFLSLAERFSHRALLAPLLEQKDQLTGLHANTQIPKVIGFARIAELGGNPAWRGASAFFWKTVVEKRSVAFGGNSVREHFHPAEDFGPMLESREGPETCNTYNMLRLTELLFRSDPSARYADYYERALFNHILSSQHPEHGGFVYFTPIRPRHYRVYSQPQQCFWCCVGSGIESHGKQGAFIYAQSKDSLYVNLFIASELAWKEKGLRLRQETRFPEESSSVLSLQLEKPVRFTLKLRHPAWIPEGEFTLKLNGQTLQPQSKPSSYAELTRDWQNGDRLELSLPMAPRLESLPDASGYAAVLYGPLLLAAKTGTEGVEGLIAGDGRMAHVAPGPYEPMDSAPMLVGEPQELASALSPIPGRPLHFKASSIIRPQSFADLEFMPFHQVHDTRAMTYWRVVKPGEYAEVVRELEELEKQKLALEARTLDRIMPGEQQPEVEHGYQGEDSQTGINLGRRWRDAGRWFSYVIQTKPGEPSELMITTFGADRGRRFRIYANDSLIATVSLEGKQQDRFVQASYVLPAITEGRITLRFVAEDKSRVAPIYDLRVLKKN